MRLIHENELDDREEYIKMLLYGQSGSGKTTFACSWPNVVLIDLERGRGRNKPKLTVEIEKYSELNVLITHLKDNPDYYNNYETVVIDSLNEMIELVISDIVLGYELKSGRPYDDQLTQSDYGKINREIMKLVRTMIRDLSGIYNLIFICGENQQSYQDEQKQLALLGKVLPINLPRLMDIVACSFTQKEQHIITISNTSFAYAKNRYGVSGKDGFIKPSYDNLINVISEESE